jgi:hypothetical protein
MLLGSSMTGRLPDRKHGFEGVANLGCDGGNALDLLRAFDRGQLPPAPWLVIEGNTFYRSLHGGESELARAMRGLWFRAGMKVPQFGAAGRPSGFLYAWLMARKFARQEALERQVPVRVAPPGAPPEQAGELSAPEQQLVEQVAAMLRRLEQRGARCLIVMLPPGAEETTPNHRLPLAVAAATGSPWWDLARAVPRDSIRYTDQVHMSPASARLVVEILLEELGDVGGSRNRGGNRWQNPMPAGGRETLYQ